MVIFHKVRGGEVTSEEFQYFCGRWDVVQRMGRVGPDNPAA
ncbi:hypothetical protein SAMN02745898_11323 [Streptomyces sp. 136MFCol5.1]|nr:hypothetical protein SAMN02745898_11323 [Streptomyces sp. 136MFCol5.1]